MSIFDIAQYRDSGAVLKAERTATKKTSAKLNPVLTKNRFLELEFPDPEFFEYPKMIAIPLPMTTETINGKKVELPDEEELPVVLRRKITEWEDEHGQLHQRTESDKAWLKRVKREWPMNYPIAGNPEEERWILAE